MKKQLFTVEFRNPRNGQTIPIEVEAEHAPLAVRQARTIYRRQHKIAIDPTYTWTISTRTPDPSKNLFFPGFSESQSGNPTPGSTTRIAEVKPSREQYETTFNRLAMYLNDRILPPTMAIGLILDPPSVVYGPEQLVRDFQPQDGIFFAEALERPTGDLWTGPALREYLETLTREHQRSEAGIP